jgi:hypothetical protein
LKAEALAAFEKLKRPTAEGGFALRYVGYGGVSESGIHDLLVEYRGGSAPLAEVQTVNVAERANGVEARVAVRVSGGASFVRESVVRELRAGEVKPRRACSSPGTEVSEEWKSVRSLGLTAEKSGGVWWFSDLVGEIVAE